MATASITPDQDTIHAEIFIAAPPQRVFQAITDPGQTRQWWGQSDMYRVTDGQSDLRPGGKWYSAGVGKDGSTFRVEGEYLEISPPTLLVYTWNASWTENVRTVVRWELMAESVHGLQSGGPHKMGTGTRVKIRHSGFAGNVKEVTSHGEGWKRVLGWMQLFVEQGKTIDNRG
jgi:uncharacterized protein YndB with AHSA1/START domain